MLADLAARGVNELHVEAGAKLNGSFVRENPGRRVVVYMAPRRSAAGATWRRSARCRAWTSVNLRLQAVDRVYADLRLLRCRAGGDVPARPRCDNRPHVHRDRHWHRQVLAAEPMGSARSFGRRLTVQAPPGYLDEAQPGDSIALNGACA